ncbi:uncharacterized protein M6B38_267020 [Iris pallida]|uniref:Uncharacterized protein n=1 Tax=Iris pallida TaxID=29817 RepID=A0AAX6I993_IRIPA|nr:uncharacterized protein M6B38_267015 [Iris pallida]KAJ6849822.1 uncharacterized protein M6B38_267020 [Iris pallida]
MPPHLCINDSSGIAIDANPIPNSVVVGSSHEFASSPPKVCRHGCTFDLPSAGGTSMRPYSGTLRPCHRFVGERYSSSIARISIVPGSRFLLRA